MVFKKYIRFYFIIILSILNGYQAIYRSQIKLSTNGFQFQPVYYQGQILSAFMDGNDLAKSCSVQCNQNILCRIFDINAVVPNQCRLFQGDMNIHGNIVPSNISNAQVGTVQYSTDLYLNYDQPCSSQSEHNRYLSCGQNSTWKCSPNTYWNPTTSMCMAQSPLLGSICQQNMDMCREDLNYTCLQFNQCGPLSLLMGTTLLDSSTIIAQSPTVGLNYPYTVLINKTTDNCIILANSNAHQIISFYDMVSSVYNVSLVAQTWNSGNTFSTLFGIAIHPNDKSVLYASDRVNQYVIEIVNMQVISPSPTTVAGVEYSSGSGTNTLNYPSGIDVDSNGNIYIADSNNHRVILWPPNSTTGIVIAGLGTAGSDSFSLNSPLDVYLDENNSDIYVADTSNHRIQRFSLLNGFPSNGTTVAGGNGAGTSNTQLNTPFGLYISKKTKAMYIADSLNHRVQRWKPTEQSGITLAGDPNGNAGSSSTLLNYPYNVAVDDDETFLYVVDTANHRLQRFQLI